MHKSSLTIGIAAAVLLSATAVADESEVAPLPVKRQIAVCMTKAMSANKTLSYNEAQRDCKDRIVARNQNVIGKRTLSANAADAPALKTP